MTMPYDDNKVVERMVHSVDNWIVEIYCPVVGGPQGYWKYDSEFSLEEDALEYIRACKFRLVQEARIEYSEEEVKG
ncbi:MAG: hypothetical protein JKY52_09555 [Flavobacteriales bacterium]|nr:hypothetical protein [Flavobacteriales bacterium]